MSKVNLASLALALKSGDKSPISVLNEIGVEVTYTMRQQTGPSHCPHFVYALTVADMTFEGQGTTKKEAKTNAAQNCINALVASMHQESQEFTNKEPSNSSALDEPLSVSMSSNSLFGATSCIPGKNAISIIYEKYPSVTFTCTMGDGSPVGGPQEFQKELGVSLRYKVICEINDQKFEGFGTNKKLAKLAAATCALAALDDRTKAMMPASVHACAPGFGGAPTQIFGDHISKLVKEKYAEVMQDNIYNSKMKVFAGIVITIENQLESAKVIAVTTGTKCISGEYISVTGRAVNDCHAEVLARRCLQRYLYSQLLMYASQPDPNKLIPDSDIEPVKGGEYRLKSNRQIHMYLSTAPCGDGRVFSPHEHSQAEPDRHPNRRGRGLLRAKIESGEGTIPVKNCNASALQTWDGVLQGQRLQTMSCSDKIARWCVVGLQGSLLSKLMEPVYLDTLVIGSFLQPEHLQRALYGRIEAYVGSLPGPFKLHRPVLIRTTSTETRNSGKTSSFCVSWCVTTPLPELINGSTGKLMNNWPSLLCKQTMLARWQYLAVRLLPLSQPAQVLIYPEEMLYKEAKLLSVTYKMAKECLMKAFEEAKLGRWIKKPIEQDLFYCELTNADPMSLFI